MNLLEISLSKKIELKTQISAKFPLPAGFAAMTAGSALRTT